jgi:hypothetical protein
MDDDNGIDFGDAAGLKMSRTYEQEQQVSAGAGAGRVQRIQRCQCPW